MGLITLTRPTNSRTVFFLCAQYLLRYLEIVVGQGWIQDLMPVGFEISRLYAARSRLPAVKEEDEHVIIQVRKGPTNNGPILPEPAFS